MCSKFQNRAAVLSLLAQSSCCCSQVPQTAPCKVSQGGHPRLWPKLDPPGSICPPGLWNGLAISPITVEGAHLEGTTVHVSSRFLILGAPEWRRSPREGRGGGKGLAPTQGHPLAPGPEAAQLVLRASAVLLSASSPPTALGPNPFNQSSLRGRDGLQSRWERDQHSPHPPSPPPCGPIIK